MNCTAVVTKVFFRFPSSTYHHTLAYICFPQLGWDVFKPSKQKIKCLRCSLLKSKVKEIPIWFPAFDLMLRKYQGLRRKSIWASFHESVTVENTCEHLRLRIPTVRLKSISCEHSDDAWFAICWSLVTNMKLSLMKDRRNVTSRALQKGLKSCYVLLISTQPHWIMMSDKKSWGHNLATLPRVTLKTR